MESFSGNFCQVHLPMAIYIVPKRSQLTYQDGKGPSEPVKIPLS